MSIANNYMGMVDSLDLKQGQDEIDSLAGNLEWIQQ